MSGKQTHILLVEDESAHAELISVGKSCGCIDKDTSRIYLL